MLTHSETWETERDNFKTCSPTCDHTSDTVYFCADYQLDDDVLSLLLRNCKEYGTFLTILDETFSAQDPREIIVLYLFLFKKKMVQCPVFFLYRGSFCWPVNPGVCNLFTRYCSAAHRHNECTCHINIVYANYHCIFIKVCPLF